MVITSQSLEGEKQKVLSPQYLEVFIGKILGEHKNTVFRGFQHNYSDLILTYINYELNKAIRLPLRAGIHEDPPQFTKWEAKLKTIFGPIKIYMDKKSQQSKSDQANKLK